MASTGTAMGTRMGTGAIKRPQTASQTFFATSSHLLPSNLFQIPDGRFTFTIYSLIKQKRFEDVIAVLENELRTRTATRASLSLLAYAHFQLSNFDLAASIYETLLTSEIGSSSAAAGGSSDSASNKYKLYLAQCFYRAGAYDKAEEVCLDLSSSSSITSNMALEVQKLQFALRYESNDVTECYKILQTSPNPPSTSTVTDNSSSTGVGYQTMLNTGCLLFKEQKFQQAIRVWMEAIQKYGSNPDLDYNLALAFYFDRDYVQSLRHVSSVIERGVKDHPQFSPSSPSSHAPQLLSTSAVVARDAVDGERNFVQNSNDLHESRLIEAYNLRAAIEKHVSTDASALQALNDMPARRDEDIDAITLHNLAVLGFRTDVKESMAKLNHLLQIPNAPEETLTNSLLLCIAHELYDSGADLLAQSADLMAVVDPDLSTFIVSIVNSFHSSVDSIQKLDQLARKLSANVIEAMKQVQEAKELKNDQKIKEAIALYDQSIDLYAAVILSLAKIHWGRNDLVAVDRVLKQSMDYLSDRDEWKLAVANVLFMQEKYLECLAFFEPVINGHRDDGHLLTLQPITLANTCVAYILTNQNAQGEKLMSDIEQQEDLDAMKTGNNGNFHLCIVNLVIGVLYCSRGNFEFGLNRIIASFDPLESKLSPQTWFIAKTVLLSLIDLMSKHMILVKDLVFEQQLFQFLDQVARVGERVPASLDPMQPMNSKNSVASEARLLKLSLLKLYHL